MLDSPSPGAANAEPSLHNLKICKQLPAVLTQGVEAPETVDFTDKDKFDYIKHAVVPNAVRKVQSRLQIHSPGFLPKFDDKVDECAKNGGIKVPPSFKEENVNADFVLFVGFMNVDSFPSQFMGLPCYLGNSCST